MAINSKSALSFAMNLNADFELKITFFYQDIGL